MNERKMYKKKLATAAVASLKGSFFSSFCCTGNPDRLWTNGSLVMGAREAGKCWEQDCNRLDFLKTFPEHLIHMFNVKMFRWHRKQALKKIYVNLLSELKFDAKCKMQKAKSKTLQLRLFLEPSTVPLQSKVFPSNKCLGHVLPFSGTTLFVGSHRLVGDPWQN